MKTYFIPALLAATLCVPALGANNLQEGNFTFQTFDVSGVQAGLYNLTVNQISNSFLIVGDFGTDGDSVNSTSYLRKPNGEITEFIYPQTNTSGQVTHTGGVNIEGTAVGYFWDTANSRFSGFFYRNGKFENYNVPGQPAGTFTLLYAINDLGAFCGFYQAPPSYAEVAFVNFAGRMDTNFSIPGSTFIYPGSVNDLGQVAGSWFDSAGTQHGFLRSYQGQIATIDVPGAGSKGTEVVGVNDYGWISGHFFDTNSYEHGFVRSPEGVYYQIDVPGAATSLLGGGTGGGGINDAGVVVGHYDPADGGLERGYIAIPKHRDDD